MRRRLPPLEQIEAFVEAARGPNFRSAAERCALSPAAFSRRIQAFSSALGVQLFERRAGGAHLTEAGMACLEELEPAYMELRRAAAAVARAGDDRQEVRLSLSHSLAVGWLIPRLDEFRAAHPNIDISLKTQRGASDVRRGEADLGLCFSDVDVSGLVLGPSVPVMAGPVASPEVAEGFAASGGLMGHRLLAVTQPADMWAWWAKEGGLESAALTPSARFDMLHAMYETAAEGLGVALGASPTVSPFLKSRRLVRLPLPLVKWPGGYRLVTAPERRRRPAVATVWRWLERQAQQPIEFL
jgi:DNA-binding transcriptional LysR family regulator